METFEAYGTWWIPGFSSHKVCGTLKFEPQAGAILTTINGSFMHELITLAKKAGETNSTPLFQRRRSLPRILGNTDQGQITLIDSYPEGMKWARAYEGASYVPKVVYQGCHFKSEPLFSSIATNFTSLEHWLGSQGLDEEWRFREDDKPESIQHTYMFEDDKPFKVNDNLTLVIGHNVRTSGDRISDARISKRSYIDIQLLKPATFQDLERNVIYHLQNFLILATGSPVRMEHIQGKSKGCVVETDTDQPLGGRVSLYFRPRGYDIMLRPVNRHEMLFRFDDIEDDFGRYVGNWISMSETLRPVIDLYFSLFYIPSMYVHLRFLTLVQALETYHRRVYGGEYMSATDFEPVALALVECVPSTVSKDHRESMKGRIKYLHEFSLKKRLRNLLSEGLNPYRNITDRLIGNHAVFIDKVVETRNYLTHYSGESPTDSKEQARLAQKMLVLLQLCFCAGIGFPEQTISNLIPESRAFMSALQ